MIELYCSFKTLLPIIFLLCCIVDKFNSRIKGRAPSKGWVNQMSSVEVVPSSRAPGSVQKIKGDIEVSY